MPWRLRPSRAAALAAALALALVLAACGRAPATGEPSGSSQETKPIRIGASLSLTGSYERTGKNMQQGYELWRDHVNARGGLLGRPVELIIYDDQSEPETAARLYEKLITEDKVDLLLGPYSTPVSLSATNVTERHQFPILVAGASGAQIWGRGYKYVFGLYTVAQTYSYGALTLAAEHGLKTVAIVHEDTAFTIDVADGAEAKARELGLEVVLREPYPKTQTDFSTIVAKLKQAQPDVVVGGTYLPASVAIVRQSKELGFTPKLFFFSVGPGLPEFVENLGPLAENVMGDSQWEPVMKASGIPEFIEAYKAKYGVEPGYHAAGAYAAGQLLEQVVAKAGSLDREKLREAWATLEGESVYGPYKVDETGKQVGKPTLTIQYQQGKRVVVWPDELANAEPVIPFVWGQ